jgi:excisionase family DNA binding protein
MANTTHTVRSLAEHLGVSARTVLAWIATGELRATNVARSPAARRPSWRITAQAVAEFEATRTAAAPAPPRARRRKRPVDVVRFY